MKPITSKVIVISREQLSYLSMLMLESREKDIM